MNKKVIITGAGLSGLSGAAQMAFRGFDVEVFEKNEIPGGRARHFQAKGFTFDMGPTWYWFPEIFEHFFNTFGQHSSDFYDLVQLDPSYRIFFDSNSYFDISPHEEKLLDVFETIEKGSSKKLVKLLHSASVNYDIAINKLIYNPGYNLFNYLSWPFLSRILKYKVFHSYAKYVRTLFHDVRLIRILEFPLISLGASTKQIPAFYSLMNYADLKSGTWYPIGGMYKIVEAILKLLDELQVPVHLNSPVETYDIIENKVTGIHTHGKNFHASYFVSSADYYHTEQLLSKEYRNYSEKYWNKRQMAPSALIYFLGINKKLEKLQHHNLFYDTSFDAHLQDVYHNYKWPESPVLYVCCTTKTDAASAPKGMENLSVIIPVAPGLEDTGKIKEHYYDLVIKHLERITQQSIRDHVIYKRAYAKSDFQTDYNAFLGNAFGLANTYFQSGFLKPKIRNRRLKNFFYCGHLTVPGPGMPSSLVSGEIIASEIQKMS